LQEKVKRGLGRGLDALLPPSSQETRRIIDIEITKLRPAKSQPRTEMKEDAIEELAASIREHGILSPIIARPKGDGNYEIVAGERRWRAAQKAGLLTVPVILKDIEDVRMLEIALVENVQREDLNPVELARAYKTLIDQFDLTQEEMSAKIGKDRATIANTLRLLTLSEPAQRAVCEGLITFGHAKALLSIKSREKQEELLLDMLRKGISVREAEKIAASKEKPHDHHRKKAGDPDTRAAEAEMTKKMGLKVAIARKGKGGGVTIFFKNEDELHHIWEWICHFGRRKK